MGVTYDTDDIRRSARVLGRAADQMNDIAATLTRIGHAVPEALQGDAGETLEELIQSLRTDSAKMSGGISSMSRRLKAFAEYLDRMDREMAEAIRSNQGG